jgi:nucleoside-diphosphate-sugar epimerase
MRALVSGNAGFIGRNFTRKLVELGWVVEGFDIKGGVDARAYFPASDRPFDLLIHAAAVVGGRQSIDGDPLGIFGNAAIDHVALSWAARTGTPMLYFSSSAAYPVALQHGAGHPLHESDLQPLGRVGPADQSYGTTKAFGERMVADARRQGARVTVVRPFSGYGTDQDTCYPFPAFVDRAKRRESPFAVWGDGAQVRDFVHVDDVFEAAMRAWESGTTDPVNLCTGVGTSFLELAHLVTSAAGYGPTVECLVDKPVGVRHRVGDPTRMRRYWEPKVTLAEGVERALAGVL